MLLMIIMLAWHHTRSCLVDGAATAGCWISQLSYDIAWQLSSIRHLKFAPMIPLKKLSLSISSFLLDSAERIFVNTRRMHCHTTWVNKIIKLWVLIRLLIFYYNAKRIIAPHVPPSLLGTTHDLTRFHSDPFIQCNVVVLLQYLNIDVEG